jgi:hypothetical protein
MMILSVRNSTTLHLLHKVRQINEVVAGSFLHSVNVPVFANVPVFVGVMPKQLLYEEDSLLG